MYFYRLIKERKLQLLCLLVMTLVMSQGGALLFSWFPVKCSHFSKDLSSNRLIEYLQMNFRRNRHGALLVHLYSLKLMKHSRQVTLGLQNFIYYIYYLFPIVVKLLNIFFQRSSDPNQMNYSLCQVSKISQPYFIIYYFSLAGRIHTY